MPANDMTIPLTLRASIMNQRIYPLGSPIVEKANAQLAQALQESLKTADRLVLSDHMGKIYFNGQETPPEANALSPILTDHRIQSLTFLPGLTAQEINALVTLLCRKLRPGENPADSLAAEKCEHVQVDKVTVVEVLEGEVVTKRMDAMLGAVGDFPGLVGSLRDAFDMIDKIPEERGRAEAQDHLASRLAVMDATIIRDMFSNELPKRVEDSGLRNAVLNSMTQDKLREIFSEIGSWYRLIREQSSSDFEVVEHLNKLKSFLGKLLTSPESKNVPFALYEELLNQGLLDKIPPGVQKRPEDESLAVQVDRLLEKPAAELLELPVRDQLPLLLKKLCDLELHDLTKRLLERMTDNFTQGTTLVRQLAFKSARSFLDILWANKQDRLWNQLYTSVEQLMEVERSIDVYQEIAGALAANTIQFILNERFTESLKVLSALRRHAGEKTPLMPRRAELAGLALQQVADGIMDVIIEDLLSSDRLKNEAAQTVLSHLGERAVPVFIGMILKADDMRHRRLAASALKQHGETAKNKLAAEFHVGNSTGVLLHVLSVLDDFLTPELLPRFEAFVHFPDATVRKRIVQLLQKLAHPGAAALLLQFLGDDDEPTQVEAARACGDTGNVSAVPRLMDLARGGSTLLREEACLALGKLADGRAVSTLGDVLQARGGLFKKRAPVEETVRVRAAWALAQIKTPEAREALTRAQKDPNMQIQSIARQAL